MNSRDLHVEVPGIRMLFVFLSPETVRTHEYTR
jgi:hypothetical protein